MSKNCIIALYLRISDEDEGHSFLAEQSESNSITGQRELLKNYINSNLELSEFSVIEFSDDGWSGTNFDRPGIKQLLEQAKTGNIHCILVKDFSRFGRNYIEVGNFLEQVFPFLGVRFISVNDNFDSTKNYGAAGAVDVVFKNLIHDLYSKDISQKIISARRIKAEQGKFITSHAPYGFQKSKEQRLVIDEESAAVVQRIYKMALEGISQAKIARILNAEHVPSPLMLRRMRKQNFPRKSVNEQCHWTTCAIHVILKDQRYVGDGIYGKVKPSSVGSGKDVRVPNEEWIIVRDVHDTIIPREMFVKIQKLCKSHLYKYKQDISPLAGKVRCASCNHAIPRRTRNNKSGQKAYYHCKTRYNTLKYDCYGESILEQKIEDVVLIMVRNLASIVETIEHREVERLASENQSFILMKQIGDLERMVKRLDLLRLEAYEAYKGLRISREEFLMQKINYEKKLLSIETQITEQKDKLQTPIPSVTPWDEIAKSIKKFSKADKLTREITDTFIDTVYVNNNGSLSIVWNFENPFEMKDFTNEMMLLDYNQLFSC